MEKKDKQDVPGWPSDLEGNTGNKTGDPLGMEPGLKEPANHPGRGQSCGTRTQVREVEQKIKVDVPCWPSNPDCNTANKTGAPLGLEPGLIEPANHPGRGRRCGTRTQARAMEQKDKVDVPCWPSKSDCNTGNKTAGPLGIEPGLIESAIVPVKGLVEPDNHPGRDHSCDTRTEARPMEQRAKVDVSCWSFNTGNETGAPLGIEPGLKVYAHHPGRGHSCGTGAQVRNKSGAPLGIEPGLRVFASHPARGHSYGIRTQARATEQKDKVDVPCWPANLECPTGNKTGAPPGIEPGLRVLANQPGRGHSCVTMTQARATEQKYKVDVSWWPSNLGCHTGNKTGATLGIKPGLREPANHPGRGHSCGTRTQARATEQKDKVDVPCWPSNLECPTGNKTGAPPGIEPGLRVLANQPGRGHSCVTMTQARATEQKYKVDVSWWPSNLGCHTGNKTGATLGIKPGLREPANHPGRGHSCGTRTQARATEQKDKVDVPCWPSNLECHTGNKTGAPPGIEPGLRVLANQPGRGHSCGTRTQARAVEQKYKVNVSWWPSNVACNTGSKTGAPLGTEPGLIEPANHPARGHSCGTRTQARAMEQKCKVDVSWWPSNLESNMGSKTGAPPGMEPGLREPASHPARGHSCGTWTQSRAVEQKDKVDVPCCTSNLESNMGNKTGAPSGIEPGNHHVRGHSCGTRTQAWEHSQALPALGSEKRLHGVLQKRRQIRLPRATRAVAHKPLRQDKKSSAKARGHTQKENTSCQPDALTVTGPQEGSSQGPPVFCWPPPLPPPPYMTMTLGQHLIASPSVEPHEAFALSSPCSDTTPLPCSSVERHPPEPQGPIASDQASVSATSECQETLEAAEALMTLKNSSWTWRQTHS
ncbi:uncharacterized protein LOC101838463 [Mesocricetus auratus]|uniref:Uncharacterized protein LOC101838463 n=1 Tax=Mesocricetus auratus TaxID=10036 RepID=A0ABM2XBM9_MESAU|nr:uncharacterized protein LOC101838463 [Mesocricetus auratus]